MPSLSFPMNLGPPQSTWELEPMEEEDRNTQALNSCLTWEPGPCSFSLPSVQLWILAAPPSPGRGSVDSQGVQAKFIAHCKVPRSNTVTSSVQRLWCMCFSLCAYMDICMFMYVYICIYISVYLCMYISVCVHMYACLFLCLSVASLTTCISCCSVAMLKHHDQR